MAKYVKVKIAVNITGSPEAGYRIQRTYPPEYFAVPNYRLRIIQLTREADLYYNDIILRDDNTDHCICVVPDEALAGMIASPNIEEITQEQAETQGALWRPQEVVVVDENVINAILDKVAASQALTLTEMNAIDPDNAEVGRFRGPAFADLLTLASGDIDAGN